MKRIIVHWTGGGYKPSGLDLQHYNEVIDGEGFAHAGKFPISANSAKPLVSGSYAAHTLNCNSDSIGLAVACMAGAKESPFVAGSAPMRQVQYDALVKRTAFFCRMYGIPVTPETVLSHAEVQPNLGIKQRGKWDITWYPGSGGVTDPQRAGNVFRRKVIEELARLTTPAATPVGNWFTRLLAALFGGKK